MLLRGQVIWDRDAGDFWPWFMIEGSDHQGSIDITEFVAGKSRVRLEFRLHARLVSWPSSAQSASFRR